MPHYHNGTMRKHVHPAIAIHICDEKQTRAGGRKDSSWPKRWNCGSIRGVPRYLSWKSTVRNILRLRSSSSSCANGNLRAQKGTHIVMPAPTGKYPMPTYGDRVTYLASRRINQIHAAIGIQVSCCDSTGRERGTCWDTSLSKRWPRASPATIVLEPDNTARRANNEVQIAITIDC